MSFQSNDESLPSELNFSQKLENLWAQDRFVCVGLDPRADLIPSSIKDDSVITEAIAIFNSEIVEATYPYVCAYKPNVAFYERYGEAGWSALSETIRHIKDNHPEIPVILDAKRADIGSTNEGYVEMAFDELGADAITANPYFGMKANMPFLERADKGVIWLVRTSNPGAGEFQDIVDASTDRPLYQVVAHNIAERWNQVSGNCSIVVGATYPDELRVVREIVGNDMPILIPGIGAQGGDLQRTIEAGGNEKATGMIINSSRGIIHASTGEDFAEEAGRQAALLNQEINSFRRE